MFFRFARPAPPFPRPEAFGFAELRGGGTRVVVIPALGGKVSTLEMAGRQWLWTSDITPYAIPVDGASYVGTADTGGYDECFPTVGPCRIPSWVRRFGGADLPDHGELWSQHPEVAVHGDADTPSVEMTWLGRRLPYRFGRVIEIGAEGQVTMRYAVHNEGSDRLPFIWSAHPLLSLPDDTVLDLPRDSLVRVYAHHRLELGDPAVDHRWPFVRASGKVHDFTRPTAVARRYACKLFLDVADGHAAIEQGGTRLEVRFDAAEVPNFGVWINNRGWTPFRRQKPYLNIAFEPCIGAPDPLSEALGSWNAAHWLEPGETRRWTLVWSARRLDADSAGG